MQGRSGIFGFGLVAVLVASIAMATPSGQTPHGRWLAEDIGGGGVIDNLQTTLEIAADGAVHGLGGCNNFRGKAEVGSEKISFGPLAATKMACIPAVADQETKFFDALSKVVSWRVDAATGKLELFGSDGVRLVVMAPH